MPRLAETAAARSLNKTRGVARGFDILARKLMD